jgi:hypothetical protein
MQSNIISLSRGEPYLLTKRYGLGSVTRVCLWAPTAWEQLEALGEYQGPFFKKVPDSPKGVYYALDRFKQECIKDGLMVPKQA